MRKCYIVLVFIFMAACATVSNPRTISPYYTILLPLDESEHAWSRTHAYMSRRMYNANTLQPAFPLSNGYIIQHGDYTVTRQVGKDAVVIGVMTSLMRVNSSEGKIGPEEKIKIEARRQFISGLMEYIKTGKSVFMEEEPIPPYERSEPKQLLQPESKVEKKPEPKVQKKPGTKFDKKVNNIPTL